MQTIILFEGKTGKLFGYKNMGFVMMIFFSFHGKTDGD